MSNTAAATAATSARSAAPWPQRFGVLTRLQVKSGAKGRYAILTVDCSKFTQVAYAFGDKLVAELQAAGEGARVWFKGPIEPVQRRNAEGRAYTEDQMKVVYFKNKSAAAGEQAAAEGAAEGSVGGSVEGTAQGQAAEGSTGGTTDGASADVDTLAEDDVPF